MEPSTNVFLDKDRVLNPSFPLTGTASIGNPSISSSDPSGDGTSMQLTSSDSGLSDLLSDPNAITPAFMVTEPISNVYYKGLPSQPRLIGTTKPQAFEFTIGPEAYVDPKEIRVLAIIPWWHIGTRWPQLSGAV